MSMHALFGSLEPEIEDPEEESFLLFSQSIPSQNLGFIDSKAKYVDISVGGQDFLINQSPTILSSTREGGTTGAVVWKITPLVATWITSAGNLLFQNNVIRSTSSVLELGCGSSGIIGLALGPLIQQYILTDQEYVMRLLNQNLVENMPSVLVRASKGRKSKSRSQTDFIPETRSCSITAQALDWETDEVSSIASSLPDGKNGFDAVIACDCIYNDALIAPLVQTCADACQLRRIPLKGLESEASLCIIAQQLRSPEVFQNWLEAFHKVFRVWRVPDKHLINELVSNSGFVIHIGILR